MVASSKQPNGTHLTSIIHSSYSIRQEQRITTKYLQIEAFLVLAWRLGSSSLSTEDCPCEGYDDAFRSTSSENPCIKRSTEENPSHRILPDASHSTRALR